MGLNCAQVYFQGESVRLSATFTTEALEPVVPTGVVLRVKSPDGDITEYTYGVGNAIVLNGAEFVAVITADQVGDWYYRWMTDGAYIAIAEKRFSVRPGNVVGDADPPEFVDITASDTLTIVVTEGVPTVDQTDIPPEAVEKTASDTLTVTIAEGATAEEVEDPCPEPFDVAASDTLTVVLSEGSEAEEAEPTPTGDVVEDPNSFLAGSLLCNFALEAPKNITYSFTSGTLGVGSVFIASWTDLIAGAVGNANNASTGSRPFIAVDNVNFDPVGPTLGIVFDKNAWVDFTAAGRNLFRNRQKFTIMVALKPKDLGSKLTVFDYSTNASNTTRLLGLDINTNGSVDFVIGNGTVSPVTVSTAAGVVVDEQPVILTVAVDLTAISGSDSGRVTIYAGKEEVADATGIFTGSGALTIQNSDAARHRFGANLSEDNDLDAIAFAMYAFTDYLSEAAIVDRVNAIRSKVGFNAYGIACVGDSNTNIKGAADDNERIFRLVLEESGTRGVNLSLNYGSDGRTLERTLDIRDVTIEEVEIEEVPTLVFNLAGANISSTDYTYVTYRESGGMPGNVDELVRYYPKLLPGETVDGETCYCQFYPSAADRTAETSVVTPTTTGTNVVVRGNNTSLTANSNGYRLKPGSISFPAGYQKLALIDMGRNDIAADAFQTDLDEIKRYALMMDKEYADENWIRLWRTTAAVSNEALMTVTLAYNAWLKATMTHYVDHYEGLAAEYIDEYTDPATYPEFWDPDLIHYLPALARLLAQDIAEYMRLNL